MMSLPSTAPAGRIPAEPTDRLEPRIDPGRLRLAVAFAWVAWGVVSVLRLSAEPGLTWKHAFWYGLPDAVIWAGLTPLVIHLARRRPIAPERLAAGLGFHLAVGAGIALLHSLLDTLVAIVRQLASGSEETHGLFIFLKLVRYGFHTNLLIYLVIVGAVLYLERSRRVAAGERRAAELEARLVEAGSAVEAQEPAQSPAFPDRIALPKGRGKVNVPLADVLWIQAESNYARFHVDGSSYLARGSLRALESQLDPARFVRVHRSAIVNLDEVARLEPAGHGDLRMTLTNDTEVTVSRRYRQRLEKLLPPLA